MKLGAPTAASLFLPLLTPGSADPAPVNHYAPAKRDMLWATKT